MTINVKEKSNGHFVYSFSAEKQKETFSQRTLHAVVSGDTTAKGNLFNIIISNSDEKVNEKSYSYADEEYLKVVNSGDMNTAQELIDEAAERKFRGSKVRDVDGKLLKVYHGSESESFNEFDEKRRGQTDSSLWGRGYYFSSDSEYAKAFGDNVRSFYLNITNPFTVSNVDAPASEIADKLIAMGEVINFDYSKLKAHKFVKSFGAQRFSYVLTSHGFDGVIAGDFEFVAFEREQMKLTDPVTYDNDGSVIPLTDRFDMSRADVRYSYGDEEVDLWGLLDPEESGGEEASERLQRINNIANQLIQYANNATSLKKNIRKNINSILKKYTGANNNEFTDRIELILDVASKCKYSGADVLGEIAAVVKDALVNSEFSKDIYADERKEVIKLMRNHGTVYLTREQVCALDDNGRTPYWYKQKLFGKVKIALESEIIRDDVCPLEKMYNQLVE